MTREYIEKTNRWNERNREKAGVYSALRELLRAA